MNLGFTVGAAVSSSHIQHHSAEEYRMYRDVIREASESGMIPTPKLVMIKRPSAAFTFGDS